jgi:hypothetical protein
MLNFYFKDGNVAGNINNFDWNYITYWGDGIPLLFWVFAYPYGSTVINGLSATKANANEYRWKLENDYTNKRTRFSNSNNLQGSTNSFLQFPSNDAINSNVLYNLTKNSNICGPYNYYDAVIIIDSPWARSCLNRVPAAESKKNDNYAVGVSLDMGNRIAKTYNTWSKWWNATNTNCGCLGTETVSLLPPYIKSAIQQAAGNLTSVIQNVEILMFDPRLTDQYALNEEQAGLVVPELCPTDALYGAGNGTTRLLATQCNINQYSFPTHAFGKAFVGAFVAIYKDYTENNVAVVNNLLIDVPWSGVLTGVQTYKMNSKMGGDLGTECSLNCPVPLNFNSIGSFAICAGDNVPPPVYNTNYSWADAYPAPHTFPRVGCRGGGSFPGDPCFPTSTGNWVINSIWQSTPQGGLSIRAGDGVNNNNYLYPAYDVGVPGDPLVYDFTNAQSPQIFPYIGPWAVEYKLDFSRFRIAGGGCQNFTNAASFYPWSI